MSRAQLIEERAALWVLRREEDAWSTDDQAQLDEWLAESDAHKVAYWRLDHGWREADRIAALGARPPFQAEPPARSIRWQPLALAATVLAAFALFLVQWQGLPFGDSAQLASVRLETPVGGHKVVSLPDGSRVELNTNTAIKAAIDDDSRAVWLERGEAFFDVAKRPGQAFVIYAGARTITVLGTKFSVRRTPREVVVAVLEGRVRVDDLPGTGPDRYATVTAGDVAIARDRSTLVANSTLAVSQNLAWRRGRLQFDNTTLAEAAEQFNRYNRKQLVIADAEAAGIVVAGSFLARNVDSFASLLERAYGLDVADSAGKIFLSSRRMAHAAPRQLRQDLLSPSPRSVPQSVRDPCASGGAGCAPVTFAPPPPPPVQVAKAPEDEGLRALREARNWEVLHKLYPPRALAAREEGLVGFTVKIDSGGNPTSCKITQTSGHPLLDLETCQLIMVHATFKRPDGLSRSQQRSYEGVINWKVPVTASASASAPAAPKRIAEAAPAEELVCKRRPQTGSNAAFERKCMTRSEWQKAAQESRDPWDYVARSGNRCEGHPANCR
jgi:transmembrane sensor